MLQPGCHRVPDAMAREAPSPSSRRATADLALVPGDARLVLALDLGRLRAQPAWSLVAAALAGSKSLDFDGMRAATGFAPLRDLDRVLVAVPAPHRGDDSLALVAETSRLDEARVIPWLRRRLGQQTTVVVRGHRQLVIGLGAWSGPVARLARAASAGASAADDSELRRLCERAADDRMAWAAAVVPAAVRRELMRKPRFPDVASITRMRGSFDLQGGLHAELVAELSNTPDAAHLAHRLAVERNQAKRHPDLLVRGLSPYLEALHIAARGPSVEATLDLPDSQLGDFVEHIESLAHAGWTK